MVAGFYRRYSLPIMLATLALLPLCTILGERIPSDNDVGTWLPRQSASRLAYDSFYETFGADETVLIAFRKPFPAGERIAAASGRLRGLPGVANCWTRQQITDTMTENAVSPRVAQERLVGLLATPTNDLETMLVSINEYGCDHRSQTVAAIREQLAYCRLDEAILTGGPIIANQLDKLGNRRQAMFLFGFTVAICFLLLRANIGCWRTAGGLMLANVMCIELTLATLYLVGMKMNFIMSSLPVMVMVFTTAASVHYIGHYREVFQRSNAVADALKAVIRPSAFAAVTTMIGLVSLSISDVGPVPAFGLAAAIGTFYSFIVGVFLTPAVLVAFRYQPPSRASHGSGLTGVAMYVVNHPWRVMLPGMAVTVACAIGVLELRTLIDPLEFLPGNDTVRNDTIFVAETLTSPSSIEAFIDFGQRGGSFVERLREVRQIETDLQGHDNICHVLSLADFFPEELNEKSMSLSRLSAAAGNGGTDGLIADGSRLWRLSIRLHNDDSAAIRSTMSHLQTRFAEAPITFTGLAPLLEEAQTQIFDGFWKSFASAFVLITIVMICALRSLTAGLVAMIPNLTPILLVFGSLGWADFPIDIGIMMTASIALGLAVDGTFHFLFSYRDCRVSSGCRYRAVRKAILQTGMPIICSAVISGCGLLALACSPFQPTMRFGILMFTLLMTALVGDLLLLPAFLALGARRKRRARPARIDTRLQEEPRLAA